MFAPIKISVVGIAITEKDQKILRLIQKKNA